MWFERYRSAMISTATRWLGGLALDGLSGCRGAEFTMGTAVVLSPRAIGWASTGLFGVLITVRDLIDTRR